MCSLQSSGRGPASVNTYVHIDSVLSRSPVVGHRVRILFRLTRFRLLGNRSGQGPDLWSADHGRTIHGRIELLVCCLEHASCTCYCSLTTNYEMCHLTRPVTGDGWSPHTSDARP